MKSSFVEKREDNDYTTIANRVRTVSWAKDSHQICVVKKVNGIPTNRKNCVIKRTYIEQSVNNPPYRDRGPTAK